MPLFAPGECRLTRCQNDNALQEEAKKLSSHRRQRRKKSSSPTSNFSSITVESHRHNISAKHEKSSSRASNFEAKKAGDFSTTPEVAFSLVRDGSALTSGRLRRFLHMYIHLKITQMGAERRAQHGEFVTALSRLTLFLKCIN